MDQTNKQMESALSNGAQTDEFSLMFDHKSKLSSLVPTERIEAYKRLFYNIKTWQESGEVPYHPTNEYLGGSELASDIYKKKYFLKDLKNKHIEDRPEQVFRRLAAYIAAIETDPVKQDEYAKRFYNSLYNGHFLPGGRVIAGAGDLYRLKTLANCFVSIVERDNIESIYKAAYECARTYSYGGGIGVDISVLRPQNSVVHNAADFSTGAVSFMEIYSLTTGLIGQAGRRGALMLTLDVKHPDVFNFIHVKKASNWVTKQIAEQCSWSGKFNDEQIGEIEKQVRENTQIRFANISLKVSDEFMQAVDEQTKHGKDKIIIYKKGPTQNSPVVQDETSLHYSFSIPSKNIDEYQELGVYNTVEEANAALAEYNVSFSSEQLEDNNLRDNFGDLILSSPQGQLAVKKSGDFMLYFHSKNVGELKELVKARDIWNPFVAGNYTTAEPGLIFWSTMTKYSPSNYVGRPIISTNPCGEVPLEDGGACNLSSINLSRLVLNGYTPEAKIDWDTLKQVTQDVTRFLDSVVVWNETLNPLEKQRTSANETKRLGLGVMGIADMCNQLGIGYDSPEGVELLEKISKLIANYAYRASALLSEEKGPSPIFNYEQYAKNPFFQESLDEETRSLVKEKGLRNIAILSIAPTGTISNVVLGFTSKNKHYVGVSGGIEPIFALAYDRRSESFGNKVFKVFHATVQAYLDLTGKTEEAKLAKDDEELKQFLPEYFFRTAHYLTPDTRVKIQGIAQKYIDHSISSTVNLPESVDPETISEVYLQAWKNKLKGITIYRDGSRYPILSVQEKQSEFQDIKKKIFSVNTREKEPLTLKGDEVFTTPGGVLSTPFHASTQQFPGVTVTPVTDEVQTTEKKENDEDSEGPKVCKIEMVNGQLVKSCSE